MCNNILKLSTARMRWNEKAEFNIRLTQVRIAKRIRLWVEQDGKCHYCKHDTVLPKAGGTNPGKLIATLDHIKTQFEGGTDSLANLVVACRACNTKRGAMDYDVFYALMATEGAWEEYQKQLAREKTIRDEERRKNSLIRHQAHVEEQRRMAAENRRKSFQAHVSRMVEEATKLHIQYPEDPEELLDWAIKFNERRKTAKQKAGPDGSGLLRAWLRQANFAPRKEGKGWVAVA